MATKSVFKDVTIKDKNLGRNFVYALEHAYQKPGKEVHLSKSLKQAKGNTIKKMFEDM